MDHSVPLHLNQINKDSVEVLLYKFRSIDQSGEQRGRDSLAIQEFRIDATHLKNHYQKSYYLKEEKECVFKNKIKNLFSFVIINKIF